MNNKRNKHALIIASMASMLDNFNRENIKILDNLGYEITLAANFETEDSNSPEKIAEFRSEMIGYGYQVVHIDFSRKIGRVKKQIISFRQVKALLKRDFDLVHCHSPICSVLTRIAFKKYRKKSNSKIIYTAHGFHFFKGAPLKNWVIYYPIERLCSQWTDVLITINKEDYQRAQKKMKASKVIYIPGIGIDLKKFSPNVLTHDEKQKMRGKLGVTPNEKMILSVGELSKRKNHEIVIRALSKLKEYHWKYFICGMGELESYLQDIIDELELSDRIKLLGYRKDISQLCDCADLYVFPSLQEGLPVALMEAMASGKAIVCSKIRGNVDLVSIDGGILFNPSDEDDAKNAIDSAIHLDLCKMGQHNLNEIKKFEVSAVIDIIKRIYKNIVVD